VTVFVDGCFWHRCPQHATNPKTNADFWRAKFARNVARGRADDEALYAADWIVVRIWEHEDPQAAVETAIRAFDARRGPHDRGSLT